MIFTKVTFVSLISIPLLWAETEIIVGQYPAKIVPEQVGVLSVPDKGIVSELADEHNRLEKGAIVARINVEELEREEEEMELSLARDKITRSDDVRKLMQQRQKMEFYLKLSTREKQYAQDMEETDNPASPEAIADIDERIKLSQREQESNARRKRKDFNKKRESNTLVMPFTGRLQYQISIPDDRSIPFEINNAIQQFATVCDDSAFYITVAITQAELTQLSSEQFTAKIALPGGRILRGKFAFRRVERSGSSDMLVYFFKLPEQDKETAFSMLGTNARAELIYHSSDDVIRVNKAKLVTHPKAAQCESWEQLVELAYPGHFVLLQAERELLITPPAMPKQ